MNPDFDAVARAIRAAHPGCPPFTVEPPPTTGCFCQVVFTEHRHPVVAVPGQTREDAERHVAGSDFAEVVSEARRFEGRTPTHAAVLRAADLLHEAWLRMSMSVMEGGEAFERFAQSAELAEQTARALLDLAARMRGDSQNPPAP
jgi:hypothetical protein